MRDLREQVLPVTAIVAVVVAACAATFTYADMRHMLQENTRATLDMRVAFVAWVEELRDRNPGKLDVPRVKEK